MKRIIMVGFDSIIPKFAEQFISEGRMVNLMQLKKEGAWTEAIPTYPAVTPCGWATIGTGAWPSTHGIEGFTLHFPGEPLDVSHDGFNSKFCKTEYFWEVAAQRGRKVILLKYPGSWPHRMPNAIQVGGNGGYGGRKNSLDITHSMCFSTGAEKEIKKVEVRRATGWRNLPSAKGPFLEVELPFIPERGSKGRTYYGLIKRSNRVYDTLGITRSRDYSDLVAEIKRGRWTSWIEDAFDVNGKEERGAFRMKLMELSPDGKRLKLYVGQNHPVGGYTTPPELAEDLYKNLGPFEEYTGLQDFWNGWLDLETQWEIYRSHTHYMAECMDYLLKKKEWDIFVTQCHPIDYTQHIVWAGIDPGHPDYDPSKRQTYWNYLGEVYEMMDELIGIALKYKDDDTHVVVVGDHGHELYAKTFLINNLLIKKGLLTAHKDAEGNFKADWSQSKAFATGHVSIFLNVKGREPHGIVEPGEEYETLRERIIDLLYDFKDKETGIHPVKYACKKEEMSAWGLYGEGMGDILYITRRGYDNGFGMQVEPGSKFIGITGDREVLKKTKFLQNYTSEHPDFSPYAETIRTLFAIAGPGIKKGYRSMVPTRLVDVAPTVSYLIGIPTPRQAEGMVMKQICSDD